MFEIRVGNQGEIVMSGRLDAAQCDRALQFLDALPAPPAVDLAGAPREGGFEELDRTVDREGWRDSRGSKQLVAEVVWLTKEEVIHEETLDMASDAGVPRLLPSTLGPEGAVRGAAALSLRRVLADPASVSTGEAA